MTEALTLEAAEWIWNEHANFLTKPTDGDLFWQSSRTKIKDQEAGVASLAMTEGSETADVRPHLP